MTGLPAAPPALIHAQRANLDTLALTLADKLDVPYIISVQDVLAHEQSFRVLPERLGAIIAVSPSVRNDLIHSANVPEDLVCVIPNGVEVSMDLSLPPPRDEKKIPIVGTASALEESKGLTYFLMAAELILSSGHDVEFVIAGSGPEEEMLRRLAQHLDIANRVTFVPYLQEYTHVLDTFDVFVLPSLQQGLGTIMLQAMALGKPVVATSVGGIADFCSDNLHALLVPPANHIVLAEKIRHLLDNPQKARKLATAGQQLVRSDFSVEQMAQATAQRYQKVLATRPQAAV
jgi:glycosyltransferase involved in cell wall biosynthesis